MTHKQMWLDLHKLIHKATLGNVTRIPSAVAHEIQGKMNEIEIKHTGDVEFREVEGDNSGVKHEFKDPYK